MSAPVTDRRLADASDRGHRHRSGRAVRRRRTPAPWFPVVAFLVVAGVAWVVVAWSAAHLPRAQDLYPTPVPGGGGPWFEGWARWDGFWYRTIAEEGYVYYPGVQSSVAFFPAYPMLMRAASVIEPNLFVVGSLITFGCGLLAIRWLWAWLTARMSVRSAAYVLALVLVYPFAWYLFGAVYADALFLAATLGAFVAVDRDRMWVAGLLGFVASLSRPTGVAVAIGLVLVTLDRRNVARRASTDSLGSTPVPTPMPLATPMPTPMPLALPDGPDQSEDGSVIGSGAPPSAEKTGVSGSPSPLIVARAVSSDRASTEVRRSRRARLLSWSASRPDRIAEAARALGRRFDPRALRWGDAPLVLAFGGTVSFMTFLGVSFGKPLLFAQIQGVEGWDQPAGWSTWLKVSALHKLIQDPFSNSAFLIIVQAGLTVVALGLVTRVGRRFGWGYAGYVLAVVAMPVLGSKDFVGLGRYLLPAFPCFALVGEALSRRPAPVRAGALAMLAVGMLAMASYFARGYYLS